SAWAKANAINAVSTQTGVTATAKTEVTSGAQVVSGNLAAGDVKINGVDIGAVDVKSSDADGALMNAINAVSDRTNVIASNEGGKLVLTAKDGSDVKVEIANGADSTIGIAAKTYSGKINLVSDQAVTLTGGDKIGFDAAAELSKGSALDTIDVTTREGAEKAIRTADAALKQIDSIRSDIGSTQNQLESTVRNISVTQVNVTAAESTIRDVDFAAESANLKKRNILAQSGVYAMSQANAAQQNVMRLLQ
ncbi:MAG: flagellin B, partial [Sulfurospirillum sp.]